MIWGKSLDWFPWFLCSVLIKSAYEIAEFKHLIIIVWHGCVLTVRAAFNIQGKSTQTPMNLSIDIRVEGMKMGTKPFMEKKLSL